MKCSVCGKQLSAGNQSGLCQECYRKKVNEDKIAKWKETEGFTNPKKQKVEEPKERPEVYY